MCGFAVFAMQVFRLGFDWNVNSLCLCVTEWLNQVES